ncbi:MAG: DNA-binding protein [Campylobacterales bacterium]|nr:DNA-binding protein [Campylobacterales bacterium]
MELLQILFNQYKKVNLSPDETAKVSNRSKAMLAKDRMDGVGIEYIKMGKGTNAKVFYPIKAIVEFLETNTIKTA